MIYSWKEMVFQKKYETLRFFYIMGKSLYDTES